LIEEINSKDQLIEDLKNQIEAKEIEIDEL